MLNLKAIATAFILLLPLCSFAVNVDVYNAYQSQQSDIQVSGNGIVIRLLADDLTGSRHQRFILKLPNNQTLLIAHNIDLAGRINHLKIGDNVKFYGEYEWSKKGGVVHWTHQDPRKKHENGWLKHHGKTYQ